MPKLYWMVGPIKASNILKMPGHTWICTCAYHKVLALTSISVCWWSVAAPCYLPSPSSADSHSQPGNLEGRGEGRGESVRGIGGERMAQREIYTDQDSIFMHAWLETSYLKCMCV